jgi:hypothetical protein
VRTLVAGPTPLLICDECVELCIEVIEPELAEDNLELFRLMRANEESGVADDPALLERCGTAKCPWDRNQGSIGGRAAMRFIEALRSGIASR